MSTFSPGPWRWDRNIETPGDSPEWHETGRLAASDGATILCPDVHCDQESWVSVRHADARLIAAAPEMLKLLEEWMNPIHPSDSYEIDRRLRTARLLAGIDGDST